MAGESRPFRVKNMELTQIIFSYRHKKHGRVTVTFNDDEVIASGAGPTILTWTRDKSGTAGAKMIPNRSRALRCARAYIAELVTPTREGVV